VFWGAPLPQDLEWDRAAPRFAALRVTLVAGDRDRVLPPPAFADERARLEKHGVRCAALGFEGGHEIDAATLERIAANA
jgi:predicted esterase